MIDKAVLDLFCTWPDRLFFVAWLVAWSANIKILIIDSSGWPVEIKSFSENEC
jgi:hypothetical protein